MAFLKVTEGSSSDQILNLVGGLVVLGRHPSCQIVLDNASVSRQHAQIIEEAGEFLIEDLRSRNGTQVNRQSIRGKTILHDGDEIRICDYAFLFLRKDSGPSRRVSDDSSIVLDPVLARETLPNPGDADDEDAVDLSLSGSSLSKSSVLASMAASSTDQGLRLNVRPEAKLRAIVEISLSLGRLLKLNDVLPVILKSLFKIFPQVDSGFILLKDSHSGALRIRASLTRRQDEDDVPVSMTVVKQAMDSGQAILSADVNDDMRFQNSESLADMQLRSLMCTPLMGANSKAFGVLQLSTRDLSQPFNSDDLDLLVCVGSQAAMAVENGTMHESLLRQRDLERDMEIAAQVQQSFLPNSSPAIEGYEFADYYEAAQRIGGDYFDYVSMADGRFAMVIGDVSGKGVPAALLMARLHASCRHHLTKAKSADEALTNLNGEMSNSGLGYRFITLALAILDSKRHELELCSAGHLPPLLRRADRSTEFIGMKESGMPLGVMAEQVYKSTILHIQPNEMILFYTDGITEALSPGGQLFAKDRVRMVVEDGAESVEALVPELIDAVEVFRDGKPQRDDICVMAFRRTT